MHNVQVGVATIIFNKDKEILFGKRIGAHGEGTWAFPGGHLKFNESPIDCAKRETKEEAGLEIANVSLGPWTNDIFFNEKKHYITLFMIARHKAGEPQLLEPNKCLQWQWFSWDSMPTPLFIPIQNLLQQGHDRESLLNYLPHY